MTLVQKATILALGQRVNQTGNSSRLHPEERVRVTLAVKPESAELIRVAEGHGELSLTLRGAGDEEIVEAEQPTVISNIIKMETPALAIKREVRDMDVYRGQSRSRVRFTRDRDTGKDDFQRWLRLDPAPEQKGSGSKNAISQKSKYERPSGTRQANSPTTLLTEDRERSASHRLQSDFRKIRTLFNPNPERNRPNSDAPVNIKQSTPKDSDDVSSRSTGDEIRSVKVAELYDPRPWK